MESPKNDGKKKCNLCFALIPKEASVCMHCQKNQKWIIRHFQNIGVLISIGILLVAAIQLYLANQEREDAKTAAKIAHNAKQKAELAVNEIKVLRTEVKNDLQLASKIANDALTNAKEAYNLIESTKAKLRNEKLKELKELVTEYTNELFEQKKLLGRTMRMKNSHREIGRLNKKIMELQSFKIPKLYQQIELLEKSTH